MTDLVEYKGKSYEVVEYGGELTLKLVVNAETYGGSELDDIVDDLKLDDMVWVLARVEDTEGAKPLYVDIVNGEEHCYLESDSIIKLAEGK